MLGRRFWFSMWTVTLLTVALRLGPLTAEVYKFLMIAVIGGFLGVQSWTDIQKIMKNGGSNGNNANP